MTHDGLSENRNGERGLGPRLLCHRDGRVGNLPSPLLQEAWVALSVALKGMQKGTVPMGPKACGWAVSQIPSVFGIILPNIETMLRGGRE